VVKSRGVLAVIWWSTDVPGAFRAGSQSTWVAKFVNLFALCIKGYI